ncbi:hypothetical protein HAX54_038300 [Datura stramonium]|uniref:Uncharacterized protein n=1 Tax=Datura stramonium TaxID=4076 RepID=A0ABS8VL11_DATST|nr:hypothetical protein [Datura stramonium]
MVLLEYGGSRHWKNLVVGWKEITVEDMDIAVRAHLHGWKFIFLNDVECQCELPNHMKRIGSNNIDGLFQLGSAYEWVVTKKSGRSSEGDLASLAEKNSKHGVCLEEWPAHKGNQGVPPEGSALLAEGNKTPPSFSEESPISSRNPLLLLAVSRGNCLLLVGPDLIG